jgi:hypothetical protein
MAFRYGTAGRVMYWARNFFFELSLVLHRFSKRRELKGGRKHTTDVVTIVALTYFAKVFFAKLFNPHVELTKELV